MPFYPKILMAKKGERFPYLVNQRFDPYSIQVKQQKEDRLEQFRQQNRDQGLSR